MNVQEAIERLKETRDAYRPMRRTMDTLWTLAIAYDASKQWAWSATESGRNVIKHLHTKVDPREENVRVVMNIIHDKCISTNAALSPQRIASHCEAASGMAGDQIAADSGNKLLTRWLHQTSGLSLLREKDPIRSVLGTAIVRRTMRGLPTGRNIRVGKGKDEKDVAIRNFRYGWAHVYPWEVIRDPGATTTAWARDEEIFIHEKPRSVQWVERELGKKLDGDDSVESTMGSLLDYQQQLHNAAGIGQDAGGAQSKTKAVLVYEAYFKMPDENREQDDENRDWNYMLQAWCDPSKDREKLHPIYFGPNPFYGLPFHGFFYDTYVQAPWGIGIPHLGMAAQDMANLAWTWLLRIQQQGAGKWLVYEGSVKQPHVALNSQINKPILWTMSGTGINTPLEPKRTAPPQISASTNEIIAAAPNWADRALSLSPVQRGITSARGESGAAIEQKLAQAGAPLDRLRKNDQLTYQEMLYATLVDLTNPKRLRLDLAKQMLGPDVPQEHVMALLRRPMSKAVTSVKVHGTTMNPKTPGEIEENIVSLVTAQVLEPQTAQWQMIEAGVDVNNSMADARRKQMSEIQQIIAGQNVKPSIGEGHNYHIYVIQRFIDSTRWSAIPEEAQQGILSHWAAHQVANQQQNQLLGMAGETAVSTQGQPSPPAGAAEAAQGSAGLVGSAVSV